MDLTDCTTCMPVYLDICMTCIIIQYYILLNITLISMLTYKNMISKIYFKSNDFINIHGHWTLKQYYAQFINLLCTGKNVILHHKPWIYIINSVGRVCIVHYTKITVVVHDSYCSSCNVCMSIICLPLITTPLRRLHVCKYWRDIFYSETLVIN